MIKFYTKRGDDYIDRFYVPFDGTDVRETDDGFTFHGWYHCFIPNYHEHKLYRRRYRDCGWLRYYPLEDIEATKLLMYLIQTSDCVPDEWRGRRPI